MEKKICTKCKEEKTLDNFRLIKYKGNKILDYQCKNCKNKYQKEYNKKNPKLINRINKKYYSNPKNKKQKLKSDLESYYKNIDYHKKYKKQYYLDNKEKIKSIQKQNRQKLEFKEKRKEYNKKNKEKIRINRNKNYHKKYKTDINYKLRSILTHDLLRVIKNQNGNKKSKTLELLGCSLTKFKQYLESQFLPEMNWENHGKIWEIDHIKPCSKFDLTDPEQQKQCFHYTNTQPLFKTTKIAESFGYKNYIGNRNKGNKT